MSSVVLKALGTACTQSNKDSSRIVSGIYSIGEGEEGVRQGVCGIGDGYVV